MREIKRSAVIMGFTVCDCLILLFQGPHFPEPLKEPSDLDKLSAHVDVKEKLGYVFDALTLTRHKLEGRCPLLGFSGAPVS